MQIALKSCNEIIDIKLLIDAYLSNVQGNILGSDASLVKGMCRQSSYYQYFSKNYSIFECLKLELLDEVNIIFYNCLSIGYK